MLAAVVPLFGVILGVEVAGEIVAVIIAAILAAGLGVFGWVLLTVVELTRIVSALAEKVAALVEDVDDVKLGL